MNTNANYTNFKDFLFKHFKSKESTLEITNTRIGDKSSDIKGGSYHVSNDEYSTFLNLYYRDIVSKGNPEYLTEKQLESGGAIAVDIDWRFDYEQISSRQHSEKDIVCIVGKYLDILKTMYQFDDDTCIPVYIFEKPDVNRLEDKNITKDGIHILFGMQADRIVQTILRGKVIETIAPVLSNIPYVNTLEQIFDEGISLGHVNWQLFGSRKPNNQAYQLTYVFNGQYDSSDGEFQIIPVNLREFDISKNFEKLSVRYRNHEEFYMKNDFVTLYNEKKRQYSGGSRISANVNPSILIRNYQSVNVGEISIDSISKLQNAEDVERMKNVFLDSISPDEYELRDTYEYTMTLPEKYYGEGSYDKWLRVGLALKNTTEKFDKLKIRNACDKLLFIWVLFSSQSKKFHYVVQIPEIIDTWRKLSIRDRNGLTYRSLMYWSKEDAFEKYKKVRETSVDAQVEITLNSHSKLVGKDVNKFNDHDMAQVLYQLYKEEFVCADYEKNLWYHYEQHRWKPNKSGASLMQHVSGGLRNIYNKKREECLHTIAMTKHAAPSDVDDGGLNGSSEASSPYRQRLQQIIYIIDKLGMASDKSNLMKEARLLFWDIQFKDRLDTNTDLTCFNNGVFDFKQKIFRRGVPEDYITFSTNIDYIMDVDTSPKYVGIKKEVVDFMNQLFPQKELCQYMWDHLSTTFTGNTSAQTFNMYIGEGKNGKSALVVLMSKILGDYKADPPVSLLCDDRVKIGSANPDVLELRGKRYAVMSEPKKGQKINEGMMKQLTSGTDIVKARGLYKEDVDGFYPQLKLVLMTNVRPGVNSNDFGTWRRIREVPFVSLFTENPVHDDENKPYQFPIDEHIDAKFDDWKEVFAYLLVQHYLKINGKVKDCDIVINASNKYRDSQDYISEFIRDNIVKDVNGKIKKSELTNHFNQWYQSCYNGRNNGSIKEVHEYIDKMFGKQKKDGWIGIKIRYERDELDIPELETSSDIDDISADEL